MLNIENERKRFETWHYTHFGRKVHRARTEHGGERPGLEYWGDDTNTAWEAWQEARRAATKASAPADAPEITETMIAAAMLNRSYIDGETDAEAREEVRNMLRAALNVAAPVPDTGIPTAGAVEKAVERAAQLCEAYCVCDDDAEMERVNWVLRNRAAQIRKLAAAPHPSEAKAGEPKQ